VVVLPLESGRAKSGVLAGLLAVLATDCIIDPAVAVRLYPLTRSEEIASAA